MTTECIPSKLGNTSVGFMALEPSPPSSMTPLATGETASLNHSGLGSGNQAEIDRKYFAMILKTAPQCAVCSRFLVQNPKHGYKYQEPFIAPRNYCAEHGYTWEQEIIRAADSSPATASGATKTYPTTT